MEIADLEQRFGLKFPERHRQALTEPADPIHEVCDFLIPSSPHELLQIANVNNFLHSPERPDPWPPFLVAFASNGCGDYFAYDLRGQPTRILYIDPDLTVAENLLAEDKLEYGSFEAWYQSRSGK